MLPVVGEKALSKDVLWRTNLYVKEISKFSARMISLHGNCFLLRSCTLLINNLNAAFVHAISSFPALHKL
jgi:hypothetical protein